MGALKRIAVMEGLIADFGLAQILQVLSLGRQYTGVELFLRDYSPAGSIFIKSGNVVHASAQGLLGRAAFMRLFEQRLSHFQVFRVDTPALIPEPIASVRDLLFEVYQRELSAPGLSASSHSASSHSASNLASQPPRASSGRSMPPPLPSAARRGMLATASFAEHASASDSSEVLIQALATPSAVDIAIGASMPSAAEVSGALEPTDAADAISTTSEIDAPHDSHDSHDSHDFDDAAPSADTRKSGIHIAVRPKVQKPPFVVAVASPKGGCGKTTISLNLAQSLARQGLRVVLVDADINSDVLSSLAPRSSAQVGAFDVLWGGASVDEALRSTIRPNLKILPATGGSLPTLHLVHSDYAAGWQELFEEVAAQADIVLIDTPAGMTGVTHQVLRGCTHVLGVLQAEPLAQRSFSMFQAGLRMLPEGKRPEVLGVFLNMLQVGHPASAAVRDAVQQSVPPEWLFETAIPRSAAFIEAAAAFVTLRSLHEKNPPAAAWLFDTLATDVAERLSLRESIEQLPEQRFLA